MYKEHNPPKKIETESEEDALVVGHNERCARRCPAENFGSWMCTRSKGHRGKHIAGTVYPFVYAEWYNENEDDDKKGRYSSPSSSGEPIWKLAGFDSEEAYNKWKDSYEN